MDSKIIVVNSNTESISPTKARQSGDLGRHYKWENFIMRKYFYKMSPETEAPTNGIDCRAYIRGLKLTDNDSNSIKVAI